MSIQVQDGHWRRHVDKVLPYGVKWFPQDTEERYLSGGNHHYGVDSITYCHNEYNFRQDHVGYLNLGTRPRLMLLGCSVTYGIGLPYGELWFNELNDYFDIYNFASPGCSIEFCLLTLWRFKKLIQPDLIIGILPVLERHIEIKPNGNGFFWLINDGDQNELKSSYLRMYGHEGYRLKQLNMYRQQFRLFAGDTPLKLSSWDWGFYQEWNPVLDLPFFENHGDFARDNSHFGKNSHSAFGQNVKKYLEEKNLVR